MPLVFIPYLSARNILIKVAVALLVVAWLAHVVRHRTEVEAAVRRHVLLLGCIGLFLGWMALSLIWAEDTGKGSLEIWQWYPPVMIFVIIASTLRTRREVTALCALFVAGALASMFAGAIGGGLTAAGKLSATATPERLQGSRRCQHPARSWLPSIVLAGALIAVARHELTRVALLVVAVTMAGGLVASESRGGLIAAGITAIATIVCFKRQRLAVSPRGDRRQRAGSGAGRLVGAARSDLRVQ